MNECHPKNRIIWQRMKEQYHGMAQCAEEYLGKYADFAYADKPTEQQVEELFQDTKQKIQGAREEHGRAHWLDIGVGEKALQSEAPPGCEREKDLEAAEIFSLCYDRPLMVGQANYECSNMTLEWGQDFLENAAKEGCYPTTKGEHADRCNARGFRPETLRTLRKVLTVCSERGCTKERGKEAHKRLWESVSKGCWKDEIEVSQTEHYLLDQALQKLNRKAAGAKTRLDKIEVIEGFVVLHHHTGLALDFACGQRTPPELGFNVLDCLAGNDWEKV